jgi:hypothetical protein
MVSYAATYQGPSDTPLIAAMQATGLRFSPPVRRAGER